MQPAQSGKKIVSVANMARLLYLCADKTQSTMRRIYIVELLNPQMGEERYYYFSSLIAIFHHLGEQRVGIKYTSLRSHYNVELEPYQNKEVIIRSGWLRKSKHHDKVQRAKGNRTESGSGERF